MMHENKSIIICVHPNEPIQLRGKSLTFLSSLEWFFEQFHYSILKKFLSTTFKYLSSQSKSNITIISKSIICSIFVRTYLSYRWIRSSTTPITISMFVNWTNLYIRWLSINYWQYSHVRDTAHRLDKYKHFLFSSRIVQND